MTKSSATIFPLSPAHITGLAAIKISIILAFFYVKLATIPLLIFIIICLTASLNPQSRFFLPIISRGNSGKNAVAITFDDGPDPETTPHLLALLSEYSLPATFFIPGNRASKYPDLVRNILSAGHNIGNHSYHHNPFLMIRNNAFIQQEIASAQESLGKFGITALAFRPPVGVTNPKLWRILLKLGLVCLTFSCRATDFGNRRIKYLANRILQKVRPDDIIMLHDVMPHRGMDVATWLKEIENLILGLKKKGLSVIRLEELIGRPVMESLLLEKTPDPAANFYDGLASLYDREQFSSGISLAKKKECEAVLNHLPAVLKPADRVLEIGAGTGIFTIPIAEKCREVVAVDISAGMLAELEKKVVASRITNIRCITGDIQNIPLSDSFDIICGFSSYEYVPDLSGLIRQLSSHLRPGGILYFTTANRSPFRFFTQLGNAMRQGLWLHARSRKEIIMALTAAGLQVEFFSTHLFKLPFWGGMIMEVQARKP